MWKFNINKYCEVVYEWSREQGAWVWCSTDLKGQRAWCTCAGRPVTAGRQEDINISHHNVQRWAEESYCVGVREKSKVGFVKEFRRTTLLNNKIKKSLCWQNQVTA